MGTTEVAAGILIDKKNQILLAQRSKDKPFPLQWEFPGGKLFKNETSRHALKRELKEELDIIIQNPKFLIHIEHDYELLKVKIDFFVVYSWLGHVRNNENQILKWCIYDCLSSMNLLEADLTVAEKIKDFINKPIQINR
mgnify:FL=1